MKLRWHNQPINDKNKPPKPHKDIVIHQIVKNGSVFDEKVVKPHDTVTIITNSVKLNDDNIGMLFNRKDYCDKGALIIMPQLVHPGYEGHLSFVLVNFGRTELPLRKGDKILHFLEFHGLDEKSPFPDEYKKTTEEYIKLVKKSSKNLPNTFLTTGEIEKQIERCIKNKYANFFSWKIFSFLSALIVVVTLAMSFATFLLDYNAGQRVLRYVDSYQKIEDLQQDNIDATDYKDLLKRIKILEELNKNKL